MDWPELLKKLDEIRKDGWSWNVGYAHGSFSATLWKNKKGILKIVRTAREGRYVISELGASPEDALTKVLLRHEKGTFDPKPPGDDELRALKESLHIL